MYPHRYVEVISDLQRMATLQYLAPEWGDTDKEALLFPV